MIGMFDEEEKKTDKNWLKEHDSIQMELLRMKEELLGSTETDIDRTADGKERNDTEQVRKEPASGKDIKIHEEAKTGDGEPSSDEEEGAIPLPPIPDFYRSSPGKEGSVEKIPGPEGSGQAPPRLPEGKIPASGDLSKKIANVLQIENKLKRRKYEMEKNSGKNGKKEKSRESGTGVIARDPVRDREEGKQEKTPPEEGKEEEKQEKTLPEEEKEEEKLEGSVREQENEGREEKRMTSPPPKPPVPPRRPTREETQETRDVEDVGVEKQDAPLPGKGGEDKETRPKESLGRRGRRVIRKILVRRKD